jgi:hypothetical protein
MYTLEIDDDFVDKIVSERLLHEYTQLNKQIKKLKLKKNIKPYEEEDLKNWNNVINAIDVLFDWYLTPADADIARKQNKEQ